MSLTYCNLLRIHSSSSVFFHFSGRTTPPRTTVLLPLRHLSDGFTMESQKEDQKRVSTKTLSWISEYRGQREREGGGTLKNKREFKKPDRNRGFVSNSTPEKRSWQRVTEKKSKRGSNEVNSEEGKNNGYSWEDAAQSYFSKQNGGAMNITARNVDGGNEGKERNKTVVKTSYRATENAARGYTSDSRDKKIGIFKRKQTLDSEERVENRHFLHSWRKPIVGGEHDSLEKPEDGIEDSDEENDDDDDDDEGTAHSRWTRIEGNYRRILNREGFDRPEVARWNKQENWGKKTWKEATGSTLPKMTGEVVYGVGPVLAALSVGRREFYTLYVQEGLDMAGSNRKKDKKGVGMVMKLAERAGMTIKETSKHDLNMLSDNRPHQGLILDASPLEMVSIRQLDPISCEGGQTPLWIALDEVTDPQNFGAVIRSAYFFGVTGVVVCAKNSAPLSGVVSKASAGSLECIELRSCRNMMQFLTMSAENGWRVLGGSVSWRALPVNEVAASGGPTILVLGSEGKGLRPLVERACTQLIRIPGSFSECGSEIEDEDEAGRASATTKFQNFLAVESLNVSVAAGVLLYHLSGNPTKPELCS